MRCLVAALLASTIAAQDIGPKPVGGAPPPARPDVAQAVAAMAEDAGARAAFSGHGLDILSLTWEDTGRWKGSSVGPNISDLTIQLLGQSAGARHGWCMPVVRPPNFADRTCDVPIGRLQLLVGNERGSALQRVDLRQYLTRFADWQTRPTGFLRGPLLAERDAAVLVSAQACFLPIPRGGAATFAPVLFNYQSRPGAPAVLAILVTPEGTSAQVVTNGGAAAAGVVHGQRLFHNRAGDRAPLRAVRFTDHQQQQAADGISIAGDAATRDGLSLVLVIQVPLRVTERAFEGDAASSMPAVGAAAPCAAADVETAVVASGPVEGPWIGLDGCTIERDPRFPIRATVQFYQATDRAAVSGEDATRIARAIDRIYLDADAVGSLVVDGPTGRPTEHAVAPTWPQPWWRDPCEAYTAQTGEPWPAAVARVRARLGAGWEPVDARELRNALALAKP